VASRRGESEIRKQARRWFSVNAHRFADLTEAAENCAWALDHDEWLDDPDHWVWELAIEYMPEQNPRSGYMERKKKAQLQALYARGLHPVGSWYAGRPLLYWYDNDYLLEVVTNELGDPLPLIDYVGHLPPRQNPGGDDEYAYFGRLYEDYNYAYREVAQLKERLGFVQEGLRTLWETLGRTNKALYRRMATEAKRETKKARRALGAANRRLTRARRAVKPLYDNYVGYPPLP
jgi:hypothetical protein